MRLLCLGDGAALLSSIIPGCLTSLLVGLGELGDVVIAVVVDDDRDACESSLSMEPELVNWGGGGGGGGCVAAVGETLRPSAVCSWSLISGFRWPSPPLGVLSGLGLHDAWFVDLNENRVPISTESPGVLVSKRARLVSA